KSAGLFTERLEYSASGDIDGTQGHSEFRRHVIGTLTVVDLPPKGIPGLYLKAWSNLFQQLSHDLLIVREIPLPAEGTGFIRQLHAALAPARTANGGRLAASRTPEISHTMYESCAQPTPKRARPT